MINENDPKLIFIPKEKAIEPPVGIINHIKNHWWIVHPIKGLVFWDKKQRSPQCNSNEILTKHFKKEMYPWANVEFISSVFIQVDVKDYI